MTAPRFKHRCSSSVLHDVDSALVLPPQLPLRFNDSLVLRQLRYTGMLETVRIRQSGYSIKYTFQVTVLPPPPLFLPSEGVTRGSYILRSCAVLAAGLCAPLSCADAPQHNSNQVRRQGVFQAEPPAACRVSSGQHHGTDAA